MDGPIRRAACVAALLVSAACATPTIRSSASDVAEQVPFLRAGETRLAEVVDRLGPPTYRHDADGTMIWIAWEAGAAVVSERTLPRSELVLQFDAAGTYVRGRVVHAE